MDLFIFGISQVACTSNTDIGHQLIELLCLASMVIACQYHSQCIGRILFARITLEVEGQHAIRHHWFAIVFKAYICE